MRLTSAKVDTKAGGEVGRVHRLRTQGAVSRDRQSVGGEEKNRAEEHAEDTIREGGVLRARDGRKDT